MQLSSILRHSVTALCILSFPVAAMAQPSANSKGKRKGWEIGNGNPHAAPQVTTVYKNFTLPFPTNFAYASDLNSNGNVCGYYLDTSDNLFGVWGSAATGYTSEAGLLPLTIADDGTVAGQVASNGNTFIHQNGVTTEIVGVFRSLARDGTVLIQIYTPSFPGYADITIKNGVSTTLSYPALPPGYTRVDGWSINSAGLLLVLLTTDTGGGEWAIIENGGYTLLAPPPADITSSAATALLDDGSVAFTAYDGIKNQALILKSGVYTRIFHPNDPTGVNGLAVNNADTNAAGYVFMAGVLFDSGGGYVSFLSGPSNAAF
jgi:hypothetical protein